MTRGKTIQIYLVEGTPRGIKLADITSNIEQAIFIPRIKLNEASKRKEVSKPGVYFLFGEDDESAKPKAYIGKSRNCLERIKNHDQNKEFWNYVVLIVSKTDSFTQTHIEFLEQLAIEKARESNKYNLENDVNPRQFKVPETLEADLLDNFDTTKILLSTLGFTIFETIKKEIKNKNILYCKGKSALAEGGYNEDGFIVYKGSKANLVLSKTSGPTVENLRTKLINDKILIEKSGIFEFQESYLFNSPSSAAAQVLARRANGWSEWKDKDGNTLDALKRK